jgi:hypothetical protein
MRHLQTQGPRRAAQIRKAHRPMDVTLHIGAHRTATTSFQSYMRANADDLNRRGVGFWGPLRTRAGLFAGVLPSDDAGQQGISPEQQFDLARRRIEGQFNRARKDGLRHLIVSDENMLGTPRRNLRRARLYPDASERVARFVGAFGGRVSRIVMSIREQDAFWASSLAFAVGRGHVIPDPQTLAILAQQPRSWRHVIIEVGRAAQGAEVVVIPHGTMAKMPERRLWHMTGGAVHGPGHKSDLHLNPAPDLALLRRALGTGAATRGRLPWGDGLWQPFDRVQIAAMREMYQDDLFWLRAGAEGMALCADAPWTPATGLPAAKGTEETAPDKAETHLPTGTMTRGQGHDIEEGRVVATR